MGVFSGAGFSMWGSILARTKPHRLKPAPLKHSDRGAPSAINIQGVAADKIRRRARQKNRGSDQIRRFRKSPQFNSAQQFLRAPFVFTECAAGALREVDVGAIALTRTPSGAHSVQRAAVR